MSRAVAAIHTQGLTKDIMDAGYWRERKVMRMWDSKRLAVLVLSWRVKTRLLKR